MCIKNGQTISQLAIALSNMPDNIRTKPITVEFRTTSNSFKDMRRLNCGRHSNAPAALAKTYFAKQCERKQALSTRPTGACCDRERRTANQIRSTHTRMHVHNAHHRAILSKLRSRGGREGLGRQCAHSGALVPQTHLRFVSYTQMCVLNRGRTM